MMVYVNVYQSMMLYTREDGRVRAMYVCIILLQFSH